MEYLIYAILFIGVLIPLVGDIVLLGRKHQNKNSMYLLMVNMGCLLMNGGNLLMLSTDTPEQAMAISKIEYFGDALFYFFFVLFLVSYLWENYPKWPFYLWGFFETFGVLVYWNDTLQKVILGQLPVQFEKNTLFGIYTSHMNPVDHNGMYLVRYSWVSLLLVFLLIYSGIKMFRVKDRTERANLAKVIGAQFVILLSLLGYLYGNNIFVFMPLLASLSILSIILGLIKDTFYGITEMGHEWVFEQMGEAFIIVNNNYGYLDANAHALDVFEELNRLRKQVRIPEQIYQLFVGQEEIYQLGEKYYEKKIVDIRNKDRIVGHSMLLVDVTRQQELMEKVQMEKERADAANQAKSAFVSNVSHEIRTPMNAIVGMSQILLRRELPKQERDYILNIQNSGNALLAIVNDILDMSKIESGKMELVEEEYDFMTMLNDLGMIILNRIGSKPVELIFDIDPDMPDKLYGDALRIRQIIVNLMNNATKFTEEGFVCLRVQIQKIENEDVELSISVKDSGQGIREEDISKLFGSFQQVDTKKNHNKEGTGLGLSISRQLVELMNGSIGVRSEYGKGSEFYFTIHQKLISTEKAIEINAKDQVLIAGCMKNEMAYKALQKLAETYHLKFVTNIYSASPEKGKFYYFTDCYALLSDEERKCLDDKHAVVYNLQNPMIESEELEGVETINKPLYTYNFCQVIGESEENSKAEQKDETAELSFTAKGARILIVDDNEINRTVAEAMLEPLQMQIDTAENGAEALTKVQEMKYDLVFMDHFMPVMDGIEATQEIRKLSGDYYQNLPIVALTANSGEEQRKEYLQAGMNDVTTKPIMMDDICDKIQKWVL